MRMRAFPIANRDGILESGMSLRDYFAAKAMQGMMADHTRDAYPQEIASHAYKLADAMMEAREEDD